MKNYEKRSLALHGHGKWKSALGHTLLIIGMVLMSLGVFAQAPTNGLYMHKAWVPDTTNCPDGSCGHIRLEAFVTGQTYVSQVHVPSDIVVVVDQSTSMSYSMSNGQGGTTTRLAALQAALQTFVESVHDDAIENNCDHRIAFVGFGSMPGGYDYNGNYGNNYTYTTNTELLTPSQIAYNSISPQNYKDALLYVNTTNGYNTLLNAVSNTDDSGGTMMSYGLEMAYQILYNRDITDFDPDNDPSTSNSQPRKQIVVFFTDGYPGIWYPDYTNSYPRYTTSRFAEYNPNYRYPDDAGNDRNDICETEANNAVVKARTLKQNGATVFTVGIFDGANPTSAYQTEKKAYRPYGGTQNNRILYYYWEPSDWTYTSGGPNSGDAAANGLMHFISSNYTAEETAGTTPWSSMITATHNAGDHNNGKYLAASNAAELANIFESIASESGGTPINMGAGTVVQDAISSDFKLNIPSGQSAQTVIKAYAPKCIGKNGDTFVFQQEIDGANRLVIDTAGVVVSGNENRLPDSVIHYNAETQILSFSNFNFKKLYVSQKTEGGQPINEFTGRKLVMLIPIEIDGATWGDGIQTNGPMSVIFPDGSTDTLYFNVPTADVIGETWTEVVTDMPDTFDPAANPIPLNTPEDLAWFISWVNGRHGYEDNPNVDPHPNANAILMADVDMSAHNWLPIGVNDPEDGTIISYIGTFDGNGHVITGLKNNASKKYLDGHATYVFPGMFNKVGNNGVVKNVFVLDSDFRGQQRKSGNKDLFVHHGIIADTLLQGGTIFNCEAAGRITCKNDGNAKNLKFGGLVGLNQGTIHSCMAMAELTGYTMGGMIAENHGSFSNGFTNGIYTYLGSDNTYKVGGIAGESTGSITNCYVRFSRKSDLNKATFGLITGSGTYTNSYSPEELAGMVPNGNTVGNRTYKIAQPSQWISPTYMDNTLDNTRDKMVDKLNANKGNNEAKWKRTTAGGYQKSLHGGNINGDYPVLQFAKFGNDSITCLASADGIRIDYATSLKEMLHRHNTGKMNVGTNMPSDETWYTQPNRPVTSYAVTASPAINGGTINLFKNEDVNLSNKAEDSSYESTDNDVIVYIDENISLLQGPNSTITAYTGQTLTNFGGSVNDVQAGNRWHNVSSSLKDSQFGITYGITTQVEHNEDPRPCKHSLNQTDDDVAIFPTDMGYRNTELYCFFEPKYHWINFRRNGLSHWHMDLINDAVGYDEPTNHEWIDYYYNQPNTNYTQFQQVHDNETTFIPGKGYLMAINATPYDTIGKPDRHLLQNRGTLNNGNVNIPVTYTADNEWTGLAGYNLLGNPYQSYLNFEKFIEGNSGLWNSGEEFANTYAVYDPKSDAWLQYAAQASDDAEVASQYINMHQGFMIRVSKEGIAKFTNAMRTTDPGENYPGFRGKQNFPLINFFLDNGQDSKNVAVLELGRPENGGAEKLNVGSTKGRISLRHDNQDFGILFRDITEGSQPLYFDTDEDGTFTLSWNTANADFSSLTLVDNLTGVKYDMLANDSYSFEGRMTDYRSRFKVVFGVFTDVEENEEVVTDNFAFFDGSDWVVNGQGQLTVTDMTGRTVYTSNLTNDQNRVSLNGVANGIYLMRVANGQNVNVQKIVVR